MNRYTLHKAGINMNEAMQRLRLDKPTYESLLVTFIEDNSFALLCQAIDEKDASLAFLHAHSLKGVSLNLSLTNLKTHIHPIVEILKVGSFEGVEEAMIQVKEDYQLVIDALKL